VDVIYHLAANVDNRFSWKNPYLSLENNPKATLNVALAAKNFFVPRIVFSSTGTIYGDHPKQPYAEEYESSRQTTLYGATKYASEGILSVFSEHFGISSEIFRFVGVLGPNSSHGHLFDFLNKLQSNPNRLEVLGNGYQRKSYIYVDDLINAITREPSDLKFDITNVGRSDFSTVRDSVRWIKEELNIEFADTYQDLDRGWVGDNPFLQLDVSKLESSGWKPTFTIEQAVKKTVRWLSENKWIFKRIQSD
jgi:UDP-glucose 4-epimerase